MREKVVLIHTLDVPSTLLALLFRLVGWRVIYLRVGVKLRNKIVLQVLERAGIALVDYFDLTEFDASTIVKFKNMLAEKLLDQLVQSKSYSWYVAQYPQMKDGQQKIKALLYAMCLKFVDRAGEAGALARCVTHKYQKAYIFVPTSAQIRSILAEAGIKDICPSLFSIFISAAKLGGYAYSALKAELGKKFSNGKKTIKKTARDGVDLSEYKVVYFPHKGVGYGGLFLKDQFYSEDVDSPLHPTKVLHVEFARGISDKDKDRIESVYEDLHAPYYFVSDSNLLLAKYVLKFFIKLLCSKERCAFCFSSSLILGLSQGLVRRDLEFVKKLKEARIALAGYESLFPRSMSIALDICSVITVASQERFIMAFYPHCSYIINTYFVIGQVVKKQLLTNTKSHFEKILVSGFARNILEKFSIKINGPESKKVTVFDFHSEVNEFDNLRNPIVNWKNNKSFYRDIIKLAIKFPGVHFVIRGKNDDWLKIPYFDDIVFFIGSLPNIEINRDYSQFNVSYQLSSQSDMIIARHTSIGDECIAANIPVIFYEHTLNSPGIQSLYYDYAQLPVFAFTYEELVNSFISILFGSSFSSDKNDFIKKDLFAINSGIHIPSYVQSMLGENPRQGDS